MSNVIKGYFDSDDNTKGYLLSHKGKEPAKVTGVYVDSLSAMVEHDNVYIGTRVDGGIDNSVLTNMKDINEFCLMWLLIFNPDVIKEGE